MNLILRRHGGNRSRFADIRECQTEEFDILEYGQKLIMKEIPIPSEEAEDGRMSAYSKGTV